MLSSCVIKKREYETTVFLVVWYPITQQSSPGSRLNWSASLKHLYLSSSPRVSLMLMPSELVKMLLSQLALAMEAKTSPRLTSITWLASWTPAGTSWSMMWHPSSGGILRASAPAPLCQNQDAAGQGQAAGHSSPNGQPYLIPEIISDQYYIF